MTIKKSKIETQYHMVVLTSITQEDRLNAFHAKLENLFKDSVARYTANVWFLKLVYNAENLGKIFTLFIYDEKVGAVSGFSTITELPAFGDYLPERVLEWEKEDLSSSEHVIVHTLREPKDK